MAKFTINANRFDPYKNFKFRVRFGSRELGLLDQIVEHVKEGTASGVSAMFAGEKGSGKAVTAEMIAEHLGRPVHRVDLSSVVSEYIGETEKNINAVFDAAEAAGAVLFFDEADALFGKRGEVKDAHDRYANIDVDHLLQRLESYNGIAILATNSKSNIDPAFIRRLRFMIDFPRPDPDA